MSASTLTADELTALIQRVFRPRENDRALAFIVDLPDEATPDHAAWRERREMAVGWAEALESAERTHGLDVALYWYRNVRSNNADLPGRAWRHLGGAPPGDADDLNQASAAPLAQVLQAHELVVAPTELSATAPLKVLARRLRLSGRDHARASRPAMVPALRLDYGEIDRRVRFLKALLDRAAEARAAVLGRRRGGRIAAPRPAPPHRATPPAACCRSPAPPATSPPGESYIVPYEGEREGDPSRSEGILPVQLGDEVVALPHRGQPGGRGPHRRARVRRARPSSWPRSRPTATSPSWGSGSSATSASSRSASVLLDEKLGLHIAFGRSDHFGGQVGPPPFSSPGGGRPHRPRLRAGDAAPGRRPPRSTCSSRTDDAGPDARRPLRRRLRRRALSVRAPGEVRHHLSGQPGRRLAPSTIGPGVVGDRPGSPARGLSTAVPVQEDERVALDHRRCRGGRRSGLARRRRAAQGADLPRCRPPPRSRPTAPAQEPRGGVGLQPSGHRRPAHGRVQSRLDSVSRLSRCGRSAAEP